MSEWTFFTNHALVLSSLYRHSSTSQQELATHMGISTGAVRKIINDLETGGYILRAREGRRVSYCVKNSRPLKHLTTQDKSLGDLFMLLGYGKNTQYQQGGHGRK